MHPLPVPFRSGTPGFNPQHVFSDKEALEKAKFYDEVGEYEEGRDLVLSFDKYQDNWKLVYTLGVFNKKLNNLEEARKYYKQALEMSHENFIASDIIDINIELNDELDSNAMLLKLAKENPGGVKKTMYNCLYICLITSISASLLFFFSADFIVTHFLHSRVNVEIIYIICLALPLITLSSAISGYFAGVRRIYKNAIGQFIEHISKAIICAFLISLYLPHGLDYACFALILGDFLSELISFIYIFPNYCIYSYCIYI